MDKYQLRDKAFGVIFSVILADSQKLQFTKMEVSKKLNSYYIKYGYTGGRSILVVIRNTGDIEYWIRKKDEYATTNTLYFEATIEKLEKLEEEFFTTLREDFTELIESITK